MASSSPPSRWGRWRRPAGLTLAFAAFFLLFDRLLFFGLREWACRFYEAQFDPQSSLQQNAKYEGYEGLILGSSRSHRGFDAKAIGRILNRRVRMEARAGRFPAFYREFYSRLQPHLGRLKFAIYGVDYFIFDHRSSPLKMAMLKRVTRMNVLNPEAGEYSPSAVHRRLSLLLHSKPGIDDFLNDFFWRRQRRPERIQRGDLGEESQDEEWAGPPGVALQPAGKWKKRGYRRFPGLEGREFSDLLRELSGRGIPTFLVVLPDHVGTNATNYEQDSFKADIRGLARQFPRVHFLDFNTPERFDLDEAAMFRDGGWGRSNCHLSEIGRRRFNQKLAQALKRFLPAP